MQKAKFWKLCVSYVVDVILCQIVGFFAGGLAGFVVGFVLGAAGFYTPEHMTLFTSLTALAGAIAGVICLILYFAICEARWGKTLGKRLVGIVVMQEVK